MTDEEQHGLAPSNATNLTLLGAAIAAVTMGILGKVYGIYFEAGFEAGLAGIFAALLGYLPKSGRRRR